VKRAEEAERKRKESDKRWATNAEATRQFLQTQIDKITRRQHLINLYAHDLFEIGKNTPLGDVWNEDDAMNRAKEEIDALIAQGWDGEPIDFTIFPTFRGLAEESRQYHELITFYGKTPDEAKAIQIARKEAIELETIEAYEKQLRDERAREYWEDGLPKAILYNPDDPQISILLAHVLHWCYFISCYRQTVDGAAIECDKCEWIF
jgi:hypothetical protein